AYMGSLKNEETAVLLTLGTGVGGGLIIGGKVYSGKNGVASELGHMVVGDNFYDCNCGRNGCLETYSSATGVIKYAIKVVSEADVSKTDSKFVLEFVDKTSTIKCKDVFDYAKDGDKLAKSIVDRMVKYLVRGIVNLVVTLDVEKVAIGGGVAAAGLYLIDLIESELEHERIFRNIKAPSVVLATMGNDAGVIGAALIEKFTIK
ncbi:MAG: ROK family protein, partial [Acidaminobacteraceae bacterium]